ISYLTKLIVYIIAMKFYIVIQDLSFQSCPQPIKLDFNLKNFEIFPIGKILEKINMEMMILSIV
ncbi:hypothetical protein BpHYR1_006118, partial [Brachionus plicatilis]